MALNAQIEFIHGLLYMLIKIVLNTACFSSANNFVYFF